jgi:hypothetical protein
LQFGYIDELHFRSSNSSILQFFKLIGVGVTTEIRLNLPHVKTS